MNKFYISTKTSPQWLLIRATTLQAAKRTATHEFGAKCDKDDILRVGEQVGDGFITPVVEKGNYPGAEWIKINEE